ncbi:MAG: RNA-binding domain-containing protein [Nitrosopumilaceae archaeon]
MADKLEVTVEIIAHATEDVEKILDSFFQLFKIPKDEFSRQPLTGHFDNPITLLRAKIKKKDAKSFLEKLVSKIPKDEFEALIDDIENRLQDSTLHLRFGKQDMIRGKMVQEEKDAIKFKIVTPAYNKKDTVKNYVTLLTSKSK